MKISIITVVYNNAKTIKDAIESVLNQTYRNIEYIVIDGGSNDGTVEIIQRYRNKISKFLSEKDNGLYDAMNKGIDMASGDVIGFLHSDDVYAHNDVIRIVAEAFSDDVDGVYGDLVYTYKHDTTKILRYWKSCEFHPSLLYRGWMPPHPTLFLRRNVYERFGKFDLNFKIAADYDFILRIFKGGIKTKYIPQVLYKMRIGGTSNKSLQNILRKYREEIEILKKNNIGGLRTIFLKSSSKLKQFFVRPRNA